MKIALLAPIWNQISDNLILYGVPAVVRDLALGLKKRGHQVTLFCAAGSKVSVDTFDSLDFSLKDKKIPMFGSCESVFYSFQAAAKALKEVDGKFDIIHSHMDFFPLPFTPFLKTPMVTTIHGAWFSDGARGIFNAYKNEPFVSLSDATRKNLASLNYVATIYNGINVSRFNFSDQAGEYLLFLGRFVPDKGADLAIKIAKRAQVPLLLAGTTHDADNDYFQGKIMKGVDEKIIRFVGPIYGKRKNDLLKNALALIFPVRWQEPFGLVMVEAMACGIPVIAFNRGSVSEVIRDGVTGYVIQNKEQKTKNKKQKIQKRGVEGMVEGVREIEKLSNLEMKKLRKNCRQHIEKNFTIEKMVESYEKVYQKVLRLEPEKSIEKSAIVP